MSKFSELVEKQIEEKAELSQEFFYKEMKSLIDKYQLPHDVMLHGIRYSAKDGKDPSAVMKQHFVAYETQKFLNEIYRLENYFNDRGPF